MAAVHQTEAVVASQQAYAKQTDAGTLFENLATAIIYSKPDDVLGFVAAELERMNSAGASYLPAPVSADATLLEQSLATRAFRASRAYYQQHDVKHVSIKQRVAAAMACCLTIPKYSPLPSPSALTSVQPGKSVETEEAAVKYMQEKRVEATLERLFTSLLTKRPANPIDFLIAQAKELNTGSSLPPLYSEEDLRGLFGLFDPTNKMTITVEQARVALRNVGLDAASLPVPLPESGNVDTATFVKIASAGLKAQA
jgi:hypothetical protein